MPKVVGVDNLCRDHVADVLYSEDQTPEAAATTASRLNEQHGAGARRHWEVKPDDYILYDGSDI